VQQSTTGKGWIRGRGRGWSPGRSDKYGGGGQEERKGKARARRTVSEALAVIPESSGSIGKNLRKKKTGSEKPNCCCLVQKLLSERHPEAETEARKRGLNGPRSRRVVGGHVWCRINFRFLNQRGKNSAIRHCRDG